MAGVQPLTVVYVGILNRCLISLMASLSRVRQCIKIFGSFFVSMPAPFVTKVEQPPYLPKLAKREVGRTEIQAVKATHTAVCLVTPHILLMPGVVFLPVFLFGLFELPKDFEPLPGKLFQRTSDGQRVNRAVELAILARLEPAEEVHQLGDFHVTILLGDDVDKLLHLAFRKFVLAAREHREVGELHVEPVVACVCAESPCHKPEARGRAAERPGDIACVGNLLVGVESL